ncbi:MAG: ribose 5-phosphate isomerase B [Nanoarchaeota archaeon]|nr:ribose 5-phosphate isomerase B [Nanoarchaeota archaeon]
MLYLGSDHAGFVVKEKIKKLLDSKRVEYSDLGTYSETSVDYPDFAIKVAKSVAKNKNQGLRNRGILVCGSGVGMSIAANKVKGIRAVAAYDVYTAKMSRLHNDSNILALRARNFPFEKTKKIISAWLNTDFSNEARHKKRINKMEE